MSSSFATYPKDLIDNDSVIPVPSDVNIFLTTFGRLAHVSSLRDPLTDHYDGERELDAALRDAHQTVFTGWLALSLKQQKAELGVYMCEGEAPPSLPVSDWLTQEGYRTLIPASASIADIEFFASNLRILLSLLIHGRLGPVTGSSSSSNTDKHEHSDWRVHKALEAAEENCGSPTLGLTLISKSMRVSARHLGALFQRQTGCRFRHYLRGLRIYRAAELLLEFHVSVEAVARSVGYRDASNFVRDFKAMTGVSPGWYRTHLSSLRFGVRS